MSDDNKENPCYSTFGTIPSKIIQETKTTSDATIADGPLIVKKTDKDAVKTVSLINFEKNLYFMQVKSVNFKRIKMQILYLIIFYNNLYLFIIYFL